LGCGACAGFLFYSGCVLAAFAMVATYIIGLYGAAATAVYAGAGMVRGKAEFTAGQSSFTAVPDRQHNCSPSPGAFPCG
jgi:hypothetical protein